MVIFLIRFNINRTLIPFILLIVHDGFFQARLNDMITSSANTVESNGSHEFPWTVDGAGIPPNASELLPELVSL